MGGVNLISQGKFDALLENKSTEKICWAKLWRLPTGSYILFFFISVPKEIEINFNRKYIYVFITDFKFFVSISSFLLFSTL